MTVPTYQYACTECDHRFEAVQSFSDPALSECPECDGRLRKLFSSVGIVFKGSGFYRTDSRGSAKGAGSAKGEGSSAGDSAGKTDSATTKEPAGASASSPAGSSGSGSAGSTSSGSGSASSGKAAKESAA